MANLNREPSPLIFMVMASEMVRRHVRIYVAQHPGYRIESKYISLGFAAFGRSPDVKHSRPSAFQFMSIKLRSVNTCLSIKMKTMVEDGAEVFNAFSLCFGEFVARRFDSQIFSLLFFFCFPFFCNYFKK